MLADMIAHISQPLTQRRRRSRASAARWRLAAGCAALCGLATAGLPAGQAQAATVTWKTATSANRAGANTLSSVSCVSATSCMAVGFSVAGTAASRPLAESLNGKIWSLTKAPPAAGNEDDILTGVSCSSATQCMAVGYYSASGVTSILAESWNGKTWSLTSPPNPSSTYDAFNAVSCASAKSCMGVGFANVGSNTESVAESWNGTSWKVLTTLNPGGSYTLFAGVSCTTTTNCVATGSQFDGVSEDLTLVESWNGSTWTLVPSPSTQEMNFLDGVSCVSNRCVAVGQATTADITTTLIEKWTKGGSWKVANSTNPGSSSDLFSGVSCASTTSCVAVGQDTTGAVTDTLIETLSGGSWHLTTSPDPSASYSSLGGVSCVAVGSCAAAGTYQKNVNRETLIESTF
jgi:hypothetical protein